MAHYRLYILDSRDRIQSAVDLDCADDAEAIGVAEARGDGQMLELWRGARQVRRIEPGELHSRRDSFR